MCSDSVLYYTVIHQNSWGSAVTVESEHENVPVNRVSLCCTKELVVFWKNSGKSLFVNPLLLSPWLPFALFHTQSLVAKKSNSACMWSSVAEASSVHCGYVMSRQMVPHWIRKPAEQVRGRTQQALFLSGLCFSPSSGSVTASVFLDDGLTQGSVGRVKSFGIYIVLGHNICHSNREQIWTGLWLVWQTLYFQTKSIRYLTMF